MRKFDGLFKDKVLTGGVLSEDWLHVCELARPLSLIDLSEITALVEMPCELGTLVVKESGLFNSEETPTELMEQWQRVHPLVPMTLDASSFVTAGFCLCAEGTLWVNPLRIQQLDCSNEGVLVELINGLRLRISSDCPAFLELAVATIYSFRAQSCSSLQLPATPFGQYVAQQLHLLDRLLVKEASPVKKLLVCPHLVFSVDDVAPSPCLTTA